MRRSRKNAHELTLELIKIDKLLIMRVHGIKRIKLQENLIVKHNKSICKVNLVK